jgi:hypothetical protein
MSWAYSISLVTSPILATNSTLFLSIQRASNSHHTGLWAWLQFQITGQIDLRWWLVAGNLSLLGITYLFYTNLANFPRWWNLPVAFLSDTNMALPLLPPNGIPFTRSFQRPLFLFLSYPKHRHFRISNDFYSQRFSLSPLPFTWSMLRFVYEIQKVEKLS